MLPFCTSSIARLNLSTQKGYLLYFCTGVDNYRYACFYFKTLIKI